MNSNDSLDDKRSDEKHTDEKHEGIEVSVQDVDTGAMVASGNVELDPAESLRVRKKIDRYILPLMCGVVEFSTGTSALPYQLRGFSHRKNRVQYMDKTTLGSSAILGIKQEAHLTTSQYNWLGTVFYLSYLVFEFPQNLALQRFPVAKWMSINIFVWAIALTSHAACKSFATLMVVRVILGMCEGSITAGFMIVTSMFYTRKERAEQTLRVGYWFLMNGVAQIMAGFISFGTLHITTSRFEPWQWLMVICGALTFIVSISFWFFFPDSPTTAYFLTPSERAIAILRIKANQTGLENKHFKKEQMIEALTDPKTWLFALFSGLTNIPNSLSNQKPLIVNSFGFTVLQTTLLTCVDGVIEIITISTGVNVAARTGQRAYTSVVYKIPELLGAILINALPWSNKIGLLFSLWITGVGTTGFVISLSWVGSVTAGHTKRVTTNAIMLIAYVSRFSSLFTAVFKITFFQCIGNAAGPFMWIDKYKPRNRIPWIIIGVCYITCMAILLLIRYILAAENKRRDAEPKMDDAYDNVYVERLSSEGVMEKVKVDREFLDLTDRQNRDFRYVL
ncbi:major facilitator superfamily domain-containing protein [Mycena alexandri]|uniref:Major facilitator superfamily domain-containing protein n=1 Tax=Mycena alexandri TaxID=1745969 RepID=A0AAD6SJQ8_9AGAR|nr:major facilitator superfamily domain-containing protein [Mycena alexandri]